MLQDLRRVAENIRRAETESLLDRVTVYRGGMDPAAVDLIHNELSRRGVTDEAIESHSRDRWADVVVRTDGTAMRCSFCDRPAVVRARGWHRVYGRLPLFPRLFSYCRVHRRDRAEVRTDGTGEGA